ncbi:MAG: hypothetical protein MSG64_14370 [Pyrinomonadaceae bacterium MAG19_C2-C3]|nr:hypothetical protein [Pyrinomonadaceae bacterium MAG19_C2-C3]
MPQASQWLFPLFSDHENYDRVTMKQFSDLHLYTGSKCNRQCDFCIVSGRPDGWYKPLTAETLDAALGLVPMDATIKFYGGEPTIDVENMLWAFAYLRARGFVGWLTIFTNGVLADRIVRLLEADAKTDVVLNYSILHGEDAEPIPAKALATLTAYAVANPDRIYSSHAGVFPFGRGAEFVAAVGQDHIVERMHTSFDKKIEVGEMNIETANQIEARGFRLCPRCRPVVGTDGRHHACPFAVESSAPHFDLGSIGESSEIVLHRFQNFLDWINDVLEPAAERFQIHPCLVCTHKLSELPIYNGAPEK